MTDKRWKEKDFDNFSIFPSGIGKTVNFDLEVDYFDYHSKSVTWATADALKVYKALKEYFKGSEYE